MSDDIKCPYCDADQEICHDDGAAYEEDIRHEQTCSECEKTFVFTTSIHYYYDARKADCLNGSRHKLFLTNTYPREYSRMKCSACEYERKATPEELAAREKS